VADDILQPDNTQPSAPSAKIIAIVEDDPQLASLFRDTLKEHAHWHLTFFHDGQQALQHIPHLHPDLILLDIGLPNLDGAALYKILRGHNSTRHTPIIVITGRHDWQLHRMGLQTGLFVRKPFKLSELLFIMRVHLDETPPDLASPADDQTIAPHIIPYRAP
jgi:DNA-binding response OmpR family regulator